MKWTWTRGDGALMAEKVGWWGRLQGGLGILAVAAVGWFLGGWGLDQVLGEGGGASGGGWELVLLVAGLVVVLHGVLATHELGHLLAGRWAGMRPALLVVGPLRLQRGGSGWHLGLNRSLALWGGLAACAPRGTEGLRVRMLLMTAGGPGASLLLGGLLLGLWWVTPDGTAEAMGGRLGLPEALVGSWWIAAAVGSLAIAAVTLVPGRTGGFETDGRRILSLIGEGEGTRAQVALLGLGGASLAGQRPREWSHDLIEEALALPPDTPMGIAALQMAHHHHLDSGRRSEAWTHLELALGHREVLPPVLRPALLGLGAFHAAFHHGDPVAGRAFLGEARGRGLGAQHLVLLGKAAVLQAEGLPEQALDRAREGRREAERALDPGSARAEVEWLAAVEDRCRGSGGASGGTSG